MNLTLRTLAGISLLLPVAFGCAGRTAPFDELDKAPITIMRLGQEPAPQPMATTPAATPSLIPGLPPELQKMGEQAMQGLNQVLPGVIPPGLIPGAQGQTTMPQQQQLPRFKAFVILGQPIQLQDEEVQEEILDVFGDEDSFQADRPNCFSPGMGISISRGGQAPVDLLVSFSCNQAQGDGFRWPYKVNGFTPETSQRLSKVFQKFFGPVPPGA
jgi:hypothetical protein